MSGWNLPMGWTMEKCLLDECPPRGHRNRVVTCPTKGWEHSQSGHSRLNNLWVCPASGFLQ
jgi:hypothetical protein